VYLLKIAFRNLFRRKWRTITTAGILAIAIIIFLWMDALLVGIENMSFDNIINLESGHIQIGRTDYFAEPYEDTLDKLFKPTEEHLATLDKSEVITGFTPILDFPAIINNGADEFPIQVRAIDPQSYNEVFINQDFIVAGEFVKSNDGGLVIGNQLAELLEFKVGDYFTILFRDKQGWFNTIDGEIIGIMRSPHPEMNLNTVFIAQDNVYTPLGLESRTISHIALRIEDREIAQHYAAQLSEDIADKELTVRTWQESAKMVMAMREAGQLENIVLLGLILLIGAVGIINVVILSALERMEEIGMMKALGLLERSIVKVFALEAVGIGIIGGLLGCGLGAVVIAFFNKYGISLATFGMSEELHYGIPIVDRLYGAWNPPAFLLIFFFGVVVALLASILPARNAARKDPVKTIYHR